jgi:hypothetical protein
MVESREIMVRIPRPRNLERVDTLAFALVLLALVAGSSPRATGDGVAPPAGAVLWWIDRSSKS